MLDASKMVRRTKPMPRTVSRRFAIALWAAALAAPPAYAQPADRALPDDMVVGKAKAPVTVVEYASVGCPHCAAFHIQVWPDFKAKYVDTGRVRFVYREVIAGNQDVAIGGFITARCAPKQRYFDVVDAVYRNQPRLAASTDLKADLLTIAKTVGIRPAKFESCISDPKAADLIAARSQANAQVGRVTGTPTFTVNGTKMVGAFTLENLDAAIAAAEA
jgi:protein-disulfide isomerase